MRHAPSFGAALIAIAATAALAGCSARQAYGAGQAWQRNECGKVHDAQERRRCMESASTSYEAYRRETEALKETK